MKRGSNAERMFHFIGLLVAFVVSLISISNLMPILLRTLTRGTTLVGVLWIGVYVAIAATGIMILTRWIYRLDREAGRIRNRVRWLE